MLTHYCRPPDTTLLAGGKERLRDMMPLTLTNDGEEAIVRHIGGSPDVKRHLEDLGFVPGENVRVISRIGGNVIVVVKETRLAIDQAMAAKIMV